MSGAVPPDWIQPLAEALAAHYLVVTPPAPMGVHAQPAADRADGAATWEVSLFYGKTEIVGGPRDGHRTDTSFWLNLLELRDVFDRVETLYWQAAALGDGDDLGPHIAIEGAFRGHSVRVRLLATAPVNFPPSRSADTLRGTFFDLW